MRKIYLVIILLFVSFLHLTESVFAQKTVFYDSSQDFYSSKTELSENYSCNLDELEELSISLFKQKKFTDLEVVYNKNKNSAKLTFQKHKIPKISKNKQN